MKYDYRKLKRQRMIRGWSQTSLAERAEVSPATVAFVEKGESQKPETIKKLADTLGIPMEELLIEEKEEVA